MSVLAVIPARLRATRLVRKPLRLLGGQPLVVRVLQRVAAMPGIDDALVATDSAEVAAAVRAAGGAVELTSSDHVSGTERVAEVVARLGREYDVVVNVQGDEPFVPEAAVTRAAGLVLDGHFDIGTAAAPADVAVRDDPNVVKVVCADDCRALYFSRAPIPWLRDAVDAASLPGQVWQHIGVYAFTAAALERWVGLPVHALERLERLEQIRPLAAGMSMGVAQLDVAAPGGVDTEDDLARANAQWDHLYAERT